MNRNRSRTPPKHQRQQGQEKPRTPGTPGTPRTPRELERQPQQEEELLNLLWATPALDDNEQKEGENQQGRSSIHYHLISNTDSL